jgi:hypothetical protein
VWCNENLSVSYNNHKHVLKYIFLLISMLYVFLGKRVVQVKQEFPLRRLQFRQRVLMRKKLRQFWSEQDTHLMSQQVFNFNLNPSLKRIFV